MEQTKILTYSVNYNNNNIVITITHHTENPGIVRIVYSGISRYIPGHSVISSYIDVR